MLFANTGPKQAAFEAVLREATSPNSTATPCENAGQWVDYTERQAKFYNDLIKAPALVACVAIIAAMVLVVVGQDGAAVGTGVTGLLSAGGIFAILQGLAAGADERREKALKAQEAACKPAP